MAQPRNIIVFTILAAVVFLILTPENQTVFGLNKNQFAATVFSMSLLLWVALRVLPDYRFRPGTAARHLMIWVGLFFALIIGYTYYEDMGFAGRRVMGELQPGRATEGSNGELVFVQSQNGHFIINALVDGKPVAFMLDTGASDTVLTYETAKILGIDIPPERFTTRVSTANGETTTAFTRVGRLAVGSIIFDNFRVAVSQPGQLEDNLLGMSFLNRIGSWSVQGRRLTLNP
ncbi:MAG: TIGR02281 family clan AA aspartic protease [Methylobacteriaceae bacterium]|jgi:aspartyl protease family protein|nr:TIGR02281 family clan AA aspartic protease [Methylobacteriaceae bacterium]